MATDIREQAIVDALHNLPTERCEEALRFVVALREDSPSIRTAAGLVGLWNDRDDIEDDAKFARHLRQDAEHRSRDADVAGH
jgi:hypothetical protein